MAILARALIREMPGIRLFLAPPGIRLGKMVQRNYNTLLGRYPGADGMKTGFICASGFNLVATATRDDRRLIAVVLGAPSSAARAMKAAQLLERGFNSNSGLSWLMPSLGTVETLQPVDAAPPNLRDEMCGPHRKRPATEDEDEVIGANSNPDSPYGSSFPACARRRPRAPRAAAGCRAGRAGRGLHRHRRRHRDRWPQATHEEDRRRQAAGRQRRAQGYGKDRQGCRKNGTATAAARPTRPPLRSQAETEAQGAGDHRHVQGRRFRRSRRWTAAKPKPKPAPKDAGKDAATPTAAAGPAADGATPKPKPKKPAPKPAATDITPPAQQTSQTQQAR